MKIKKKLQSELPLAKQMKSILSDRLVPIEGQCWSNAPCSRRECLELVGVPSCLSDCDLEEKVLTIFENVGFPIEGNNNEACHRIGMKK